MPMRYVKPLNAEQWKFLTDALKAGPSEEQKKAVAEAIRIAKQMKPADDPI